MSLILHFSISQPEYTYNILNLTTCKTNHLSATAVEPEFLSLSHGESQEKSNYFYSSEPYGEPPSSDIVLRLSQEKEEKSKQWQENVRQHFLHKYPREHRSLAIERQQDSDMRLFERGTTRTTNEEQRMDMHAKLETDLGELPAQCLLSRLCTCVPIRGQLSYYPHL